MNKDQINGRVKGFAGKLREDVGNTFGILKMQTRGAAEKMAGKIQADIGDDIHNVAKEKIKQRDLLRWYRKHPL